MAGPIIADRVQETSTTTGTGTYTLAGATTGFQSFAAVGNGNTCTYLATDAAGNWEIGTGTYTSSGTTLARTSVTKSSNANAAVSWAAGTKTISQIEDAAYFNGRAPLASPALTGTPTAPTATLGDNSTTIATTAFVLANAGMSLLATVNLTSGNTQAATGLALTGYSQIIITVTDMLVSGGSGALGIAVSSDNGSTYDTTMASPGSIGFSSANTAVYGTLLQAGVAGNKYFFGAMSNSTTGYNNSQLVKTGVTNAIRFSAPGSATWANGTAKIYGVK